MTDSSQDDARLRATEAQMRRALGLQDHGFERSEPDRSPTPLSRTHTQRRRFVQEGEVPVRLVHRQGEEGAGTNLLDTVRRALQEEVSAREALEHSLAEAQATIRDLQTKLAHERLGRDELAARVESERRADKQAIEALNAELAAERLAREQAAEKPRRKAEKKPQDAPRKRGRPRKVAGKPTKSSARPKAGRRVAAASRDKVKAKRIGAKRGRPKAQKAKAKRR